MTDQIYFQWQNDVLRKTIYPLREMKLRDFLVFYQEIDLWKQYAGKTLTDPDIQAEVQAYKNAQVQLWLDALKGYHDFLTYFMAQITDVAAYCAKVGITSADQDEMSRINKLHALFAAWLPKITNPHSENYFVSQRVYEWETHRKDVAHQISECQRLMRNYAPFPQYKSSYDKQAAMLQVLQNSTLKMADAELQALYDFLAICNRLEKRRSELAQERSANQIKRNSLALQLSFLTQRISPLQNQVNTATSDLAHLQNPPALAPLQQYFLTPIAVTAPVGTAAAELASKLHDLHNSLQQAFQLSKENYGKLLAIQNGTLALQQYRSFVQQQILILESNLRNMPATWSLRPAKQTEHDFRVQSLNNINIELGKLADFQAAVFQLAQTPAQLAALIQQKQQLATSLNASLSSLKAQAQTIQDQISALDAALNQPDESKLAVFSPTDTVSVQDIATGHSEAYRASLLSLDHMQLLEMVVRRFLQEPDRYPVWLQYMVVHFSGMRYASAHGSWADPKDLVINLRTSAIETNFRKLDQDAIDGLCKDKLDCYGQTQDLDQPGPTQQKPALALTQDPTWKAKVDHHLDGIASTSPYWRRRALLDLLLDEQNYEVQNMDENGAQQELQTLKDTLPIPDWMWTEIVRETLLRVQEVKDPGWETLTPEQQEEKDAPQWAQYRQIMADWMKQNLTDWRPEHAETDELIVTRSVCNEVAEQIQHLRGNVPPGGLSAKPDWYQRLEGAGKGAGKPDNISYFARATPDNLREGASILWLRFSPNFPNPWDFAKPLTLKNGDPLLPPELFSGGNPLRGNWSYQYDSGTIKRTGNVPDANGNPVSQVQWLRWIHEATVVEVAETAEGTVALTFETALPYEDKRLSTIGVFKQGFNWVTYSISPTNVNPAFVGYTPPGDIPYDNLEHMLDWNHIMLQDDFLASLNSQKAIPKPPVWTGTGPAGTG